MAAFYPTPFYLESNLPELPEVETTKRGIAPHITEKTLKRIVIRQRELRWPIPETIIPALENQQLLDVCRRGKYLLLRFATGTAIWHLGMSGSLRLVTPDTPVGKHDHVDWVFEHITLRFNDPRRFGALLWTDADPKTHFLLAHLGPEPLSDEFDANYFYQQTRKSQQAIKVWLMNAQNVVGVGNIYANESLFASGIHPLKPAQKVSQPKCARLVEEIKKILNYAIQCGGTTLRDFVGGDGKPGYFAQELSVYGRGGEPCKRCGKPLTEKRIAQRTTVYCTNCQT